MKGAAARAGISPSTLYEHINNEPFFRDQIEVARGEAEAKLVDAITTSSHTGETITTPGGRVTVRLGDWRAAAWLLEHHPETRQKFAAIQKTQLSGDPDNPAPVQVEAALYQGPDLSEIVRALHEGGALVIPPGKPALPEPKKVNGQ